MAATPRARHVGVDKETKLSTATETSRGGVRVEPGPAPIVVAVDTSSSTRTAIRDGIRLARDLDAPIIFVYVRRGPSAVLGEPYFQRRLDAEMAIGNRALGAALAVARRAGVAASGEQLHGNPAHLRKRLDDIAARKPAAT